jgi:hypothetical protein
MSKFNVASLEFNLRYVATPRKLELNFYFIL